jgi:hypothetical protein
MCEGGRFGGPANLTPKRRRSSPMSMERLISRHRRPMRRGRLSFMDAATLFAAARAFPARYERLEWWDTSEGPLTNPDVTYPELDKPAAFACANRTCSLPVFTGADLTAAVDRMTRAAP